MSSLKRRRLGLRGQILLLVLIFLTVGTAIALMIYQPGPKTLSEGETRDLLRELPYHFEFRPAPIPDGADGAIAGVARGPHGTLLRFGVSLGRNGRAVSLGPHTDLSDAPGGETFRVTDNSSIIVNGHMETNPQIKSVAEWHEAISIAVAIQEKLCRATEGRPCAAV